MPKAPADYQMRYPIDFAEIGPNVHKVVQLYAQDHGKSRGILWTPTSGKPKTCVIMAHPRGEFGHHYSIPFWVEAGYAAFAHNTRYLNNDSTMIHESILLDLAAAMKYLREEEGFQHIVMLGNSGAAHCFPITTRRRARRRGVVSHRPRAAVRPISTSMIFLPPTVSSCSRRILVRGWC